MVNVAVTGAAGKVGRVTLEALSEEHDVTPITHREHPDIDGIVLDVEDEDAVAEALAGQDAVVHLAGNPSPTAEWESVLTTNIDGTQSVYRAAVEQNLDRVAFASSNHVQHMRNTIAPSDPGETRAAPVALDHDDPFYPDSFYGVSKMAGEGLGYYYAARYDLDIINMRIGWLLDETALREFQEQEEGRARHARCMFWSPRDCKQAMSRVVVASLPESPVTVNLLSRNRERYFSITHAMRTLGYTPKDDSHEILHE